MIRKWLDDARRPPNVISWLEPEHCNVIIIIVVVITI
jgi:hypothetical protein